MPHKQVLWLDSQLPAVVAKWIRDELGIEAHSTYMLGLLSASDHQIFREAKKQQHITILTKDGDFPKLLFQFGSPPKLIKLETGNIPNRKLWELLKPLLPQALQMLSDTGTDIIYINYQNH